MMEMLKELAPMLWEGTVDTLYMTVLSTFFAYLLGLPMGVLLSITDKGGILENRPFNTVFGWIINILRSFPFVILMIAIVPFTRLIAGKIYGPTAAVVPLVIAAAPFVARLVESSLAEIDAGVIEAAKCMGATTGQIILRVMLTESVPSLVRGLSITTITLIGYSAMAGAVGAGGLGDIAIRYGLHRYETDVMMITIVLLIVIVCLIQLIFDHTANHIDKRNR
ncbi:MULTISPECIES: methionine ABC transporter permease [Anaerotruncus]|jgi:D-methionine transport system permease protein|uniref:methionine ABC transporter permease n=1 Tax=Anaerotruncus TaxID=244127 RepID=UPI00082BA3B8|nr:MULTISPECIES: methionine ABC transporter permease [Anaerotruncus]RGX56931.1 ABC transporter permease [Anaerotruncus sp. AF02-27]